MRGIIIMASLVAQGSFPDSSVGKESAWNAGNPGSIPGSGRSTGKGVGYPFLCSWTSLVAQWYKKKKSTCQCRSEGLIPGSGRSSGEGNVIPLQCSCLGNPMDRWVWLQSMRSQKSRTWLNDQTTTTLLLLLFQFYRWRNRAKRT